MIKRLLKQWNLKKFRLSLKDILISSSDNPAIIDFQNDALWFAIHDKILMMRPEYAFFKNLQFELDEYILDFIEQTGDSLAIDSYMERAKNEERNSMKKKKISQLVFFGNYINQDINMIKLNKLADDEELSAIVLKNIKKYMRVV